VFGEDIGQEGWSTAAECGELADALAVGRANHVLNVCCCPGGTSYPVLQRSGCRLTGIDRRSAAIAYAQTQAPSLRLADRATFAVVDCGGPPPFEHDSASQRSDRSGDDCLGETAVQILRSR